MVQLELQQVFVCCCFYIYIKTNKQKINIKKLFNNTNNYFLKYIYISIIGLSLSSNTASLFVNAVNNGVVLPVCCFYILYYYYYYYYYYYFKKAYLIEIMLSGVGRDFEQ
jgi:hypothetical protein